MEFDIANQPARRRLPFSGWWPVGIGALAGIVLRLVFSGTEGERFVGMSAVFIYLAPAVVGIVTAYIAEQREPRTLGYHFLMGGLANILFIAGTMAIMIEGLICAVIIVPLFYVFGGLAAIIMALLHRATRWAKQALYGFAVLPLVLGGILPSVPEQRPVFMSERHVFVDAAPGTVWKQLLDAPDIQADEMKAAWMYRIGVPLPHSGLTERADDRLVRQVKMGKGIQFDQVATEWKQDRYIRWTYRFAADSFPPRALDDHVKIGGHYFDLIDTEYLLAPGPGATTRLSVRMRYRVSTQFNWYAVPIARFLIDNFEEQVLGFYSRRAVAANANP